MTLQELHLLLKFLHDQLGHASIQPIFIWITNRFYRPKLYSSIKEYLDSCHHCQLHTTRNPKYSFTGSVGISGLFLSWSIDLLDPFPESQDGFKYIFVAVEHLSRYPIAVACKDTTGATSANLVLTHIISNFGSPQSLYLDAGTNFTCHYFKEFAQKWKIELSFAPPGTHELNGLAKMGVVGSIRFILIQRWIFFIIKLI